MTTTSSRLLMVFYTPNLRAAAYSYGDTKPQDHGSWCSIHQIRGRWCTVAETPNSLTATDGALYTKYEAAENGYDDTKPLHGY